MNGIGRADIPVRLDSISFNNRTVIVMAKPVTIYFRVVVLLLRLPLRRLTDRNDGIGFGQDGILNCLFQFSLNII